MKPLLWKTASCVVCVAAVVASPALADDRPAFVGTEAGVSDRIISWLRGIDSDFSSRIVRRLADGSAPLPLPTSEGNAPAGTKPRPKPAQQAQSGNSSEQQGSSAGPLKAIEDKVGEWMGGVQDWLARASSAYQSRIVRPLSRGPEGGSAETAGRRNGEPAGLTAQSEERLKRDLLERKKLDEDIAAAQRKDDEERTAEARQKVQEEKIRRDLAQRKRADQPPTSGEPSGFAALPDAAAEKRVTEERAAQAAEDRRLAEERAAAERKAEQEAAAAKSAEAKRLADERATVERKAREEVAAAKAVEAQRLAEEQLARAAEEKRVAAERAEAKRRAEQEAAAAKAAEAKRLAEERAAAERKAKQDAAAVKETERKRLTEERAAKAAEAKRLAEERAAAERKLKQEAAAATEAERKRLAEERTAKVAEEQRLAEERAEAKRKAEIGAMADAASRLGDEVLTRENRTTAAVKRQSSSRDEVEEGSTDREPRAAASIGTSRRDASRATRTTRRARRTAGCRNAGRKVRPPATYVVARGDTLWDIAERHYHKAWRYPVIYRANRSKIDDPDLIFPCQRLFLPARRR